jgi:cytochrome c nitrite reductase small subunit
MLKRSAMVAGVVFGVMAGLAAGIGGYTFIYAKGISYMTNDPRACDNCHIMNEQYNAWQASSHHTVAVCNDCHTPHALIPKYITKGLNGYHHSLAFTTGRFHEPIQITKRNAKITEAACRRCHGDIVQQIDRGRHGAAGLSCIRCHRSVGHLH